MILQDIWQGVGDIAGGAGKMAGGALTGAWRATRAGQSLERADQRKRSLALKEQFDIIKGPFDVEVKREAARKIIEMTQGTKIGQMMQTYQPTGEELATPEQRRQKYLDPSGYRQLRSATKDTTIDDAKKLSDIANATTDEKLAKKLEGKIGDMLFPENLFDPSLGVDPLDMMFGGVKLGDKRKETDNRQYFEGPDIVPEKKEEPEIYDWRTGKRISGHSYTPSDYFQMATETSPEENIPKTHEGLGLTRKQSEEDFERIREFAEKNIENFNIEQSYLDNTEHYEKLFLAMREGVPDGKGGKRKLTDKEIIEILKSMGR